MKGHNILSLIALAALGVALLPSGAISQQKSLKDQLIGTWTVISYDVIAPDGSKKPIFSEHPSGYYMLDSGIAPSCARHKRSAILRASYAGPSGLRAPIIKDKWETP